MESISKIKNIVEEEANVMTDEEYMKAKEFYKFLVSISKCNHGILVIDRKKLIDIAAAYMETTPIEAYNILLKMRSYGWIKEMNKEYIIVNLEENM